MASRGGTEMMDAEAFKAWLAAEKQQAYSVVAKNSHELRRALPVLEGLRYAIELDLPCLMQAAPQTFLPTHARSLLEMPELFKEVLRDMNLHVSELLASLEKLDPGL